MSGIADQPSRRALLRKAAVAIGAVGASVATSYNPALAQAPPPPSAPPAVKQAKEQAAYQDHPSGDQQCNGCANFVSPDDCRVIQGPVSSNGWCRHYKSKA